MDSQDDEQAQKSAYINEHIIGKGYNPDDLSNFIIRKRGVKIDELPFNILKKSIEQFKNEQLVITYSNTPIKESNQKEKVQEKKAEPTKERKKDEEEKQELFDIVYAPVTYEIDCAVQEENPLKVFEQQKIKIKIVVSDPQTITQSKSIFSKLKQITSFLITCKDINSSSRRTFEDIEWLRNKLCTQYPYRLIPPLYKPNIFQLDKEVKTNETLIYLNKFFEEICQKKILRTSMILYSFLTLPDDKFLQLKEKKNNYTLKKDFSNLITYSGKMNFGLTKGRAIYVNALSRLLEPSIEIYDKINSAFNSIINDYSNLSKHYKELYNFITKAQENGRNIKHSEHMSQYYGKFSEMIKSLSDNFEETKTILNNKIKENFNYMKLEYINLNELSEEFDKSREEYESYAIKLKKTKENLYTTQNISKMELDSDDLKNYKDISKDKKVLFEKMLPKETRICDELKRKMTLIMFFINREHDKLMKHQDYKLTEFSKEFKKEHENISRAQVNILSLISEIS